MQVALLLLLSLPAAAQLRKLTPVPPPARSVFWHECGDAPMIGRFSGLIACGDGRKGHVELLVYQRNAGDEGRLLLEYMFSKSAADRLGRRISGSLTEGKGALELKGEETVPGLEAAPVQGSFKRLGSPPDMALYSVTWPGVQTGRLEFGKTKGHVIMTWEDKTSCEGDLKKTQAFKVVCE